MDGIHRLDLFQRLNDKPHAVEWFKVSDAAMRIEAILSGQAVVVAAGEPIAVQPTSIHVPETHSNITPIPHTVVVLKHLRTRKSHPEKRARRVGRISRQYMMTSFDDTDESNDCCAFFVSMCSPPRWLRSRHTSSIVTPGPLILC